MATTGKKSGSSSAASARLKYRPASTIWQLLWAPMRLQVLIGALQNGYFETLKAGPATAAAVAKSTKTNARAARMVLDELAAEGLLKKSGAKYTLSPEAALYLVSDSPVSMIGMLGHGEGLAQAWRQLPDVMRTGRPVAAVDETATGEEFFRTLVRGLFAASYASANLLLPRIELDSTAPLQVLDVAGGSAAWSLPFVQKYKRATGVVADLPGVLPVAEEFAEKLGVADRYEYIPGDIRKTNFGKDRFDLVILGHICHSEGPKWSKSLIKKCAAALKPGGWLVIPDMIPNDQRTGPVFPLLFAINMLINTNEGDTFTPAEYKAWSTAAGLKFDKVIPATMIGTEVVIARKPAGRKR